jgi:formate hydrogenlyase subunit 6/NADH:ubiquinone oxidoreductase subunit I
MENKLSYWSNIALTARTLLQGLSITLSHILQARKSRNKISIQQSGYFDKQTGIATVQYPFETIPVPDNGRYKLHNEIEDCIVCDKCVKVCPVNCITIEPIRSAEEFGKTSDGTPKRIYAAKFDIDMGKCCFCGLCTTVCPTECLTMTKEYDFATFDITEHNFRFGNMTTSDIEARKKEWEEHQKTKAAIPASTATDSSTKPLVVKPVFKPRMNPPTPPAKSE